MLRELVEELRFNQHSLDQILFSFQLLLGFVRCILLFGSRSMR